MDKVVGKIIILREICENKSVLFGPFSEEITLQRKVDIWNQILDKGKSLGLLSYDKDYKYMRDVFWQNLKRSALGKKKGKLKTGREKKYSPIDDLVLEILKKSNAPIPPLPKVVETFTKQENEDSLDSTLLDSAKLQKEINEDSNVVYLDAADAPDASSPSPVCKKKIKLNKKRFMNEEKMKKRKMALQVEYMELQNYKLKLEVLEMEQKLGINPSQYTKDVVKNFNVDRSNGVNIMFKEIVTDESDDND